MAIKTKIYVYAHWKGMLEPKIIGILSAQQAKGKMYVFKLKWTFPKRVFS